MTTPNQLKIHARKTMNNFNSIIIPNNSIPSEHSDSERQGYNVKAKEIKFLRRFEEIFKREYLQKQRKQANYIEKSQFQFTNRLKGMFILKKRSDFSEGKSKKREGKIYDDDEESDGQHPVQGKSLEKFYESSPNQASKKKQKRQQLTINKQAKSGKLFTTTVLPIKRPITQLDITRNKIFNYEKIISIILKANKVSLNPLNSNNFSYFSVFIEDGNNSQMIKAAIRKRSGWRVVEIPGVAQMVWSQYYRARYDLKIKKKVKEVTETKVRETAEGNRHSLSINTQYTLSPIDDSPLLATLPRAKKLAEHRKSIEQNINRISIEQYNREVNKLCPYLEHIKRNPLIQLHSQSNCYFYNHIPNNHYISDKKHLLENLKKLYEQEKRNVFEVIPYSVEVFLSDSEEIWENTLAQTNENEYWIIKPGEDSNRGRGITICKGVKSVIQELNSRKKRIVDSGQETKKKKKSQSHIIQKYLSPFLYCGRKFDIRMYLLVTLVNKKLRGYLYEEGYGRTCSRPFTYDNFNKYVHLTNDAIQSRSPDYGKFEQGNKINWKRLQSWLDDQGYKNFFQQFQQKTRKICKDTLRSVRTKFVREHEKYHLKIKKKQSLTKSQMFNTFTVSEQTTHSSKIYFQVFGLDFFIDKQMNIWLIEANTNPALTTDCSRVVHSLIPKMIDNALTIAVQPYGKASKQSDSFKFQNKFYAVYDDQWEDCYS